MHSTLPAWIDPSFEHDACGVGLIAARDGRSSFRMLRLAVECLVRLDHRGAKAADGTGDGAGLLTELPYQIMERHLEVVAPEVPERERLGLVMAFLPADRPGDGRAIVDEALGDRGDRFALVARGAHRPGGAVATGHCLAPSNRAGDRGRTARVG